MPYQTYERYKDSGVEWLGEVPEHWAAEKGKWLFVKMDRPVRPEDDVVTAFRDGQVTLRTNRRTEGFTNAIKEHGYQGIRKGDLVIHAMDAFAGAIGVSESNGKSTPVYSACVPRKPGTVSPEFYAYLLRYMAHSGFITTLAKGIRERSTDFRYNDFGSLGLPLPPKPEQDRIVAFLDQKTAEIDALIAKKQRQIELLDEQKAILINRAVTRGLNPNAKLKPSGIEWIGEIPEHWEVKKFRYCARIRGGQVDPRKEPYRSTVLIAPDHVESGSGRILALCSANDQGAESGKYEVQTGDLIYSKIRPNLRKACIAPVDCLCSADMYAITTTDELLPTFLLSFMLGEGFTKAAVDAAMRVAMPKVNREALADFPIVLPPESEQQQIVSWFSDLESSRVNTLGSIQKQIHSLKTLRSTLIAHAVTGRIKV
jgi:type I restriction enzyme S subunit